MAVERVGCRSRARSKCPPLDLARARSIGSGLRDRGEQGQEGEKALTNGGEQGGWRRGGLHVAACGMKSCSGRLRAGLKSDKSGNAARKEKRK